MLEALHALFVLARKFVKLNAPLLQLVSVELKVDDKKQTLERRLTTLS